MTDNEIIKTLENAILVAEQENEEFVYDVLREAVDLINRQKAEIKTLNEITDKLASENSNLKEELKSIAEASREEATHDFADSLKYHLSWATEPIDEYDIDEMLRELIGKEQQDDKP